MTAAALPEHWAWQSWVSSANLPGCDFPLQNLPFCALESHTGKQHIGVGIGEFILDLHETAAAGFLDSIEPDLLRSGVKEACTQQYLNALVALGAAATSLLRRTLMLLLREDRGETDKASLRALLVPRPAAKLCKPVLVGNYTDFYASIHHALNVGRLFRPDQPLLPNYKFLPIGYHGRASSLAVSETPVVRPRGQTKPPAADRPSFGPSTQLDYELEVGVYIAGGNTQGQPIPIEHAEQHLFGISLLNDWSARDIQAWEYQPLGPFLGKSFATTVSPWVVTMDALAPFRVPLAARPPGDPEPLPYLALPPENRSAIDLELEVHLLTSSMRGASQTPVRLSTANLRDLYWSFPQMVAHHTGNGCNLLPGDLLASGTVSGPARGSQGSLLEITRRGEAPLHLPTGETRTFLEDGDEIILRGFCERSGLPRIGLGECRGIVASAVS